MTAYQSTQGRAEIADLGSSLAIDKNMQEALDQFTQYSDRARKKLSKIQSSGDDGALKVERCRQLLREIDATYYNIAGHCGAMDKIGNPLRWEVLDYLDSITDAEGRPKN